MTARGRRHDRATGHIATRRTAVPRHRGGPPGRPRSGTGDEPAGGRVRRGLRRLDRHRPGHHSGTGRRGGHERRRAGLPHPGRAGPLRPPPGQQRRALGPGSADCPQRARQGPRRRPGRRRIGRHRPAAPSGAHGGRRHLRFAGHHPPAGRDPQHRSGRCHRGLLRASRRWPCDARGDVAVGRRRPRHPPGDLVPRPARRGRAVRPPAGAGQPPGRQGQHRRLRPGPGEPSDRPPRGIHPELPGNGRP